MAGKLCIYNYLVFLFAVRFRTHRPLSRFEPPAGGSGDAAAAMRRLQNIGMQLKDSQEPSLPSAASVFANVPQVMGD